MTLSWTREIAASFLQHSGFGPTPEGLDRALSVGRTALTEELLGWEATSTASLDLLLAPYGFDFTRRAKDSYQQFVSFQQWWYLRMIYGPRDLEEKLTLFWHMHFATSFDKVDTVPLLYAQNMIFRTAGGGKFSDLLLAVSRDPAMLMWLDNDTNVKDHPNENFAREVMELFTMGINQYSQSDVTEAARAFTGWTFDPDTYAFLFVPGVHDDGVKTFLGRTGAFTGEDVIAILAARPETIDFVTRKLAAFFVGAGPSPALVARMRDRWTATGGSIREVVRAILTSDDLDAAMIRRSQVKTPAEFFAGTLRALSVRSDATPLIDYAFPIGQSLYLPPNVAGWKGGLQWINTGSYLVRMNFANDLASSRPGPAASQLAWSADALFGGVAIATADDLVDFLADRLGLLRPSGQLRRGLLEYLAHAGTPVQMTAGFADEWGRGAVHLLMCSPQYQVQ